MKRGLHVSEYGVADDEIGETHACATEEEVYELLGMQYMPPELRENRGELAAAREPPAEADRARRHPRRPALAHRRSPTGATRSTEMAQAARERGYEYLAITDHSATHGFGNHVKPDELRRQIERIRSIE